MTGVTWWVGRGPEPDTFRRLFVRPFNASVSGVRLRMIERRGLAQSDVMAALEAGNCPDIFMIPRAGDFVRLVRAGHVLNLEDTAQRLGWRRRLLMPAVEPARVDGDLFGVPRSLETRLLFYDRDMFRRHQWTPPSDLRELQCLAEEMMSRDIIPFGAGSLDFPASCEWYLSLILNHRAGPRVLRRALQGGIAWTDPVFIDAVSMLKDWYDDGWFGGEYFTRTSSEAFAGIATGRSGMSPTLTWAFEDAKTVFSGREGDLGVAPFPSLGRAVPSPMYMLGTASIIGVNANTAHPDEAGLVLDALLRDETRRRFARHVPGDWNLPLADADFDGIRGTSNEPLASTFAGLTAAVDRGRCGYATWSFFPATAQASSIENFRPMIDGDISVREYLGEVDDAFRADLVRGCRVSLPFA